MKITGKSIDIRPMTNSDIKPVVAIWWSPIAKKEIQISHLKGNLGFSFIAEVGGILAGFILARTAYLGIPIDEVCVIHALVVRPEYQRQGIGGLLIKEVKNTCTAKGISTMRALVPQNNSKLMNYLQRIGFHDSRIINLDQPTGAKV
jgi:ribosomal protein S18 acetylase RimI-like enzyme